jgi:hypothetical protein
LKIEGGVAPGGMIVSSLTPAVASKVWAPQTNDKQRAATPS